MLSAAFPHLLPKACLGKTVIPLAEGHGDSFFLSGPSSSPWGWSCWSCWSGWSLVPTEHSQQLGQGRPSQGLVHKSSLFSPKNLTFGALVLLGHRMNPIHSLSCPQIFWGGWGRLDPKPAALTPRSREFLGMLTSRYSSCCSVLQPKARPAMGAELLLER